MNKLVLRMRGDEPGTSSDVEVELNGERVQLVQKVSVDVDAEKPLARVTLVLLADVETSLVHKVGEPFDSE